MCKFRINLQAAFLCCSLLFLFSCALQTGAPAGGPEDMEPPVVVNEFPANRTINFNRDIIEIGFNEYITLNNPLQEVIVTPTLDVQPQFNVRKRSVLVDMSKSSLKENTTYTIQFGNAIRDNNRGNVFAGYQYIFSTGSYLDSLSISGGVKNALTGKPAAGFKVMLHEPAGDSALLKDKPLFYTVTDGSGGFQLANLPSDTFRLFAVNDANSNYTLESGEEVAFLDTLILLDTTIYLEAPLTSFAASLRPFVLEQYSLGQQRISLGFNYAVDSFHLYQDDRPIPVYSLSFPTKDTVTAWPAKLLDTLSGIRLEAYHIGLKLDTLLMPRKWDTVAASPFNVIPEQSMSYLNDYGTITILRFTEPLTGYDTSKARLYLDSQQVAFGKIRFIDTSRTLIGLDYDYQPEVVYRSEFLPGAFTSIYGQSNVDTLGTVFKKEDAKNYAYAEVEVILPRPQAILFQLVDQNDKAVFTWNIGSSAKVVMPYIQPGSYRMRAVVDSNGNGRWDSGDIMRKIQPERVIYAPSGFEVKANWELLDLKFDLTNRL